MHILVIFGHRRRQGRRVADAQADGGLPHALDPGNRLHPQARPPLEGAVRPAGRGRDVYKRQGHCSALLIGSLFVFFRFINWLSYDDRSVVFAARIGEIRGDVYKRQGTHRARLRHNYGIKATAFPYRWT